MPSACIENGVKCLGCNSDVDKRIWARVLKVYYDHDKAEWTKFSIWNECKTLIAFYQTDSSDHKWQIILVGLSEQIQYI